MIRVYLGLGANLEAPQQQLEQAINALMAVPECYVAGISSFYASKPMGPQDQPDYVNAVAAVDTTLPAEALLDALQQIELEQGRQRKDERWGPRTLDLDILLYGDQQIATETLNSAALWSATARVCCISFTGTRTRSPYSSRWQLATNRGGAAPQWSGYIVRSARVTAFFFCSQLAASIWKWHLARVFS